MNVVTPPLVLYSCSSKFMMCLQPSYHKLRYQIKIPGRKFGTQISESVFQNCWLQICSEECYITKHNSHYFPTFCLL